MSKIKKNQERFLEIVYYHGTERKFATKLNINLEEDKVDISDLMEAAVAEAAGLTQPEEPEEAVDPNEEMVILAWFEYSKGEPQAITATRAEAEILLREYEATGKHTYQRYATPSSATPYATTVYPKAMFICNIEAKVVSK